MTGSGAPPLIPRREDLSRVESSSQAAHALPIGKTRGAAGGAGGPFLGMGRLEEGTGPWPNAPQASASQPCWAIPWLKRLMRS